MSDNSNKDARSAGSKSPDQSSNHLSALEFDPAAIERGRATLRHVHGDIGLSYVDRLADACPDMAALLLAYPYGSIYARPGLDLRSRQIATIAALTALGDCQHELEIHIRSSLRAGLTRAEIVEIIIQMSAYAGFPRALAATKAAITAFDEPPTNEAASKDVDTKNVKPIRGRNDDHSDCGHEPEAAS